MFTGERGGRDRRKSGGTVEMVVEGRGGMFSRMSCASSWPKNLGDEQIRLMKYEYRIAG